MINILLFLLGVLKFILFSLLFLLLFIIVIILIIYFVPVKYNAIVDTDDVIKYKADNVFLDVKVSWLIGIIKFNLAMVNKKLNYEILIFGKGMGFYSNIKNKFLKFFKRKPKKKKEIVKSETEDLKETETAIKEPEPKKSIQNEPVEKEKPKKVEPSEKKSKTDKSKKSTKEKNKKPKVKFIEKIEKIENLKSKYENMKTKFDYYYYHEDKNAIIKAFKKLIKKVLRNLKPKVFKIKGELGLEDLALTGKIVGYSAGIAGYFNTNPFLVGNFKEQSAIVSGELAGKIKLSYVLSPAIRFVLHKPVFKIIISHVFAK